MVLAISFFPFIVLRFPKAGHMVMCSRLNLFDCLSSMGLQGKKNFSLYLPHHITCITALSLKRSRVTAGLIVGLSNGDIRVYNEKSLVRCCVVCCECVVSFYSFDVRYQAYHNCVVNNQ